MICICGEVMDKMCSLFALFGPVASLLNVWLSVNESDVCLYKTNIFQSC